MTLADASIWIDHLRARDEALLAQLNVRGIGGHPFLLGEIALGSIANRDAVLDLLADLPQFHVARNGEVMSMINRHRLFGRGIGYVDAHLLASVRLSPGARLWTRDKRLHQIAVEFGVAATVLN